LKYIIAVSEVVCGRLGICLGTLIEDSFEANEQDCKQKCLDNVSCEWTSFDQSSSECLLYISCTEINIDICPSCISSYKDCKPPSTGKVINMMRKKYKYT